MSADLRKRLASGEWATGDVLPTTRELAEVGASHSRRLERGSCGEVACNVTGMAGAAGMADWRDVELGAPEIARLGTARLSAARVAMLGTLRQDGSPRISPIEPYIVNGRLLVGAMRWSAKAADLRRDPRYALNSIVTGPDSGEGELKLHGIAAEADSGLRGDAAEAWWSAQPPDNAIVYVLLIGQALFVAWDIERGGMAVHRWSARDGYSYTTRTYP
ncbi:MAG TPA: pyridoxamine 5'-phosphate oxidase family protein [Streptosporangiaceae bacterium]|nr:pyridoxamine 5'-phosphate oxidase family protein [Streptosporangiaceae bacterium]